METNVSQELKQEVCDSLSCKENTNFTESNETEEFDPSTLPNVEDVTELPKSMGQFNEAIDEYHRRTEVIPKKGMGDIVRRTDKKVNQEDIKRILDPTNYYILINIAHRDTVPKSKTNFPCFRILCTTTHEDDDVKLKSSMYKNTLMDIWRWRTGVWNLLGATKARMLDSNYCNAKINTILELYDQHLKKADEEFERCLREQTPGKTKMSLYYNDFQKKKVKEKQGYGAWKAKKLHQLEDPSILTNIHTGTNQFAVVSIIPDLKDKKENEYLLCVWNVFDSEAESKQWIDNVALHYIRDYDLLVVPCGEWGNPGNIDFNQMKEFYRHPEQQRIMDSKKKTTITEQQKLQLFEDY